MFSLTSGYEENKLTITMVINLHKKWNNLKKANMIDSKSYKTKT